MSTSSRPYTIFIGEDNEWYNKLLVHTLSLNPDFAIKSFFNGKDLIKALDEQPDLVTIDYRLPDMNGSELLKKIKSINSSIQVIVISEQDDIEVAVELLKEGAFDYLVKSKDIRDRLLHAVQHIRENATLRSSIKTLKREIQGKYSFEKSLIGTSPAIKKVFDLMEKALSTNITVTITGETGTGKEVVAKAIHYNSPVKEGPFVAINMAAIPAELLESELFGHEKGSFTGAVARRIGKFEEANNGTLFLDEIGELDINFQAKLLRALQEKEIVRVGDNKPVSINCRIIIATNRDLQQEVKEGNFRQDLYYRFLGLPIQLPPLRERGQDILLIAQHVLASFCAENKMPVKSFSEKAKQKLLAYQWPGNVRELKSVIELSAVMAQQNEIGAEDLMLSQNELIPDILDENLTLRQYERRIVAAYMTRYNNSTKTVAEKLDIGQTTVYRILKEE